MADRERPTSVGGEAEGFLRRWSRRKAEARSTATAQSDEASDPEGATASLQQAPEPEKGAPSPIDPEVLPDIESLDASSDFTVFMRPGVPEHLRTLALRKLWRSDPLFSKLDGLVEYGEDYTIASWPKGAIKTAYQIGRGFANQLEKLAAAPPGAPEEPPAASVPEPGTAAPPAADPADAPSTSRSMAPEEAQPASPPAAARVPSEAEIPVARRPRPLPRRG